MRKSALLVTAYTCVSIIGTFKYVTLSAIGTLLAVANSSERPTSRRGRVDSNMSIATVWVGAIAAKEMSASGDAVRGGFMGKVASITSSATTRAKELLTDRNLGRVMGVAASVTVGTHTCKIESVRMQKAYQRKC